MFETLTHDKGIVIAAAILYAAEALKAIAYDPTPIDPELL